MKDRVYFKPRGNCFEIDTDITCDETCRNYAPGQHAKHCPDKINPIVRKNLMNQEGYTPYCGRSDCKIGIPRSSWSNKRQQFICWCGWISEFPKDFIDKYKERWGKK